MDAISGVHPGPRDMSVLQEQNSHRSSDIWVGRVDDEPLTARCYSGGMPLPDTRAHRYLMDAGFLGTIYLCGFILDPSLITALVDRWRPETHTFHMTVGETTVTLQDVVVILGLPIGGIPIAANESVNHSLLCQQVFGIAPPPDEIRGRSLRLRWLQTLLHLPVDASALDVERYSKAWILMMIGKVLCPNKKGQNVSLLFLQYLTTIEGIRRVSWGSAVLSTLYRGLCKASQRGTKEISGCLALLQIWSWARFNVGVPDMQNYRWLELSEDIEHEAEARRPLAHRWGGAKSYSENPRRSYIFYRDIFDQLTEVSWRPYDSYVLPPSAVATMWLWLRQVPLICNCFVELYCPERVLRQFGMIQTIPITPNIDPRLHKIDGRGHNDDNWATVHAEYVEMWNTGGVDVNYEPTTEYIQQWETNYMSWYLRITRRKIAPPSLPRQGQVELSKYKPRAGLWHKVVSTLQSIASKCKCSMEDNVDVQSCHQTLDEIATMSTNVLREVGEEYIEEEQLEVPIGDGGVRGRGRGRGRQRGRGSGTGHQGEVEAYDTLPTQSELIHGEPSTSNPIPSIPSKRTRHES